MHDIADLEGRGLPGVFVASTEFVAAADAQARALGFDPARAHRAADTLIADGLAIELDGHLRLPF